MFRPITTESCICKLFGILKLSLSIIEMKLWIIFVTCLCWTRTFTYEYTLIDVNCQDQKLVKTGKPDLLCLTNYGYSLHEFVNKIKESRLLYIILHILLQTLTDENAIDQQVLFMVIHENSSSSGIRVFNNPFFEIGTF